MSDDDAIIRKFHLRSSSAQSPSQGYHVRQSEEEIRSLQKENFNLKLKMYLMENKRYGSTVPLDVSNIDEKEYFDLVVENEAIKTELNEKKDLMSQALEVIEMLEKQKDDEMRKSEELAEDYMKRIEELKIRSKMCKRKMQKNKKQAQANVNTNELNLQEELSNVKFQNAELFERINDVKKENISKNLIIEKLSLEKLQLRQKCEEIEKAYKENNNLIATLNEKLSRNSSESDMSNLLEKNESLKAKIEELSQKYAKLERKCRDYEKIVNEQSEIMKGLNRTIEAKNDELDDYKGNIEFSSTKFIQDNEINLSGTIVRKFPFHNPLFGSFQSLIIDKK